MNQQPQRVNNLKKIIVAASAGTLIEWYDFFLFGSLATILSTEFFPADNSGAALLATLATFAAGLVVRPFGALVFGRMGDKMGRKSTFLITLSIMGLSTIAIGLVPGYKSIGFLAPLIILLLRLLQGLALGGEYGGATIYVAEHTEPDKRGSHTAWLQSTTGLAFILSLMVILLIKSRMPEQDWLAWGWRIPFLLSAILLGISLYMRFKLSESPLFLQAKSEKILSKNPLIESFTKKDNLKTILIAFLGLTIGGGVIGWVGFYAQSFLLHTVKISYDQANEIIIIGILMGIPFFLFFGWLSDKIGSKGIILCGMFLGLITFKPAFNAMYQIPTKRILANIEEISHGKHTSTNKEFTDFRLVDGTLFHFDSKVAPTVQSLENHSYDAVTLNRGDKWRLIMINFLIEFIFTMVYAPMAAYLINLFPLRIRYTALSVPYHLGFGIIGGLSPYFATFMVEKARIAEKNDFYLSGLIYPLMVIAINILIGLLYLRDEKSIFSRKLNYTINLNPVRKWLGLLWILLSITIAWIGWVNAGIPKMFSGYQVDIVFGCIITFIITPVAAGSLFLFGKFALEDSYKY